MTPCTDHSTRYRAGCCKKRIGNSLTECWKSSSRISLIPSFRPTTSLRRWESARRQFYNRIGTITSRSPVAVIKEFRLGYAERLLVQTKLSIDEIIYKSGFVNRSTFFRNFMARYGCTPKVYREQKIAEIKGIDSSFANGD